MAGGESISATSLFCRKCKNKVVTAVKCVNCDSAYHQSCAKLINNIKLLDSAKLICCERIPIVDDDAAFFDAVEQLSGPEKKVDLSIFTYILKQKDHVIAELRDQVKLLNDHIALLKQPIKETSVSSQEEIITKREESDNIQPQNIDIKPVPKEGITTDNTVQNGNVNKSKSVKTPPKKRSLLIIGNGSHVDSTTEEGDSFAISRIIRHSSIHLTRVNPIKTEDDVLKYIENTMTSQAIIKENIPPKIKLTKLQSRHPENYSSYKITLDSVYFKNLLDPKFWPKGVAVRKYFTKPSYSAGNLSSSKNSKNETPTVS